MIEKIISTLKTRKKMDECKNVPKSTSNIFEICQKVEVKIDESLKFLSSLLFDLQTSVRGHGVEYDQESNEHGPRHVTHLLFLLLAEIANE